MSELLRKEVLRAFRNLHRARKIVFNGDIKTLSAARDKINEEFRQNKSINDKKNIENLIQYANEVAKELRSKVVQAVKTESGTYELKVTPETEQLDNQLFDPYAQIPLKVSKRGKVQPCCQDK